MTMTPPSAMPILPTCSPPSPRRDWMAMSAPAENRPRMQTARATHLAQPMMSVNLPVPGGCTAGGSGTAAGSADMRSVETSRRLVSTFI